MTRIDLLRKELSDLEAALPSALNAIEVQAGIRCLEEELEYEEDDLWLNWTSSEKSPA